MNNVSKLLILIFMPFLAGLLMPAPGSGDFSIYPAGFNPGHLDGPFTGGFGEQTCHTCHFDYDINMDEGRLTLVGLNDLYRAGKTYELTLSIESGHLENGGFQMTSRFADGTQAGTFGWQGDQLMFTQEISDEVHYLQHSAAGTRPTGERKVEWFFTWQAPENQPDKDKVIFNIAANAGNDDDSAFGDHIYVLEKILYVKNRVD